MTDEFESSDTTGRFRYWIGRGKWVLLSLALYVLIVVINAMWPTPPLLTRALGYEDSFFVDAAKAAAVDGFEVTSQICEIESPKTRQGPRGDELPVVFHAFRVAGEAQTERLVLFAALSRASESAQGTLSVIPVNADAIALDQGFPPLPSLEDYPGAKEAMTCAEKAGKPLTGLPWFDVEAWRREAIARFGPETVNSDGSRNDYVSLAFYLCRSAKEDSGQVYKPGSVQMFVLDEFCPNAASRDDSARKEEDT